MPSLQSVTLEGEPAIRFDFKWLLYCPRLDKLILDVTGHRCMMTLDALREDLKLDEMKEESLKEDDRNHGNNNNNNAHDINNGDKNTSLNRLKSSPLTNLELHGRIAISDADIQELLTFCPELIALTLCETRQYTLSSLVAACNRHQTLKRVSVTRPLNNKQLKNLSLIDEPRLIYRSWLDRTLGETSIIDEVISNVYRLVYRTSNGHYVSPSTLVTGEEMKEETEEKEDVFGRQL
ncbi:hypothetical protein BGW41_005472 [Actinomortierella wolfii]|nr:hypothetical protein BGW41_005472 [Actinomortierella wolfii]